MSGSQAHRAIVTRSLVIVMGGALLIAASMVMMFLWFSRGEGSGGALGVALIDDSDESDEPVMDGPNSGVMEGPRLDRPFMKPPTDRGEGPSLTSGREFDTTKVMIYAETDTTNILFDDDDMAGAGEFNAIPALFYPRRVPVSEFDGLTDQARVIVVESPDGAEAVAYPIPILNLHEVVNDRVGDEEIAVTYCPLCDSVMVFNRQLMAEDDDGEIVEKTMNFGVSGLLKNSNVVFFDKTNYALWSQLDGRCISGPNAGTVLQTKPFRVMTLDAFRANHPDGAVLSHRTKHRLDYRKNPYEDYFNNPKGLMYPPRTMGDALPSKTVGAGVFDRIGDRAWFVPADSIGEGGLTLTTAQGDVVIARNEAGISILRKPAAVQAVQTFYFAWSAFHPDLDIVISSDD